MDVSTMESAKQVEESTHSAHPTECEIPEIESKLVYSSEALNISASIVKVLNGLDSETQFSSTELRSTFVPFLNSDPSDFHTLVKKACDRIDPVEARSKKFITTSPAVDIGRRIQHHLEKSTSHWQDLLLLATRAFEVAEAESVIRYEHSHGKCGIRIHIDAIFSEALSWLVIIADHLSSIGVEKLEKKSIDPSLIHTEGATKESKSKPIMVVCVGCGSEYEYDEPPLDEYGKEIPSFQACENCLERHPEFHDDLENDYD